MVISIGGPYPPTRCRASGPMGTADHYHAQLDVFVDGKPTPVPADIGVSAAHP